MQRVVRDKATPYEAPKRIDGFAGVPAADGLMQRLEEAGASGFEHREDLFFAIGEWFCDWAALGEERKFLCEEEGDATISLADGIDAGPCDFACSDQSVQSCGFVSGNTGGKNCRFE